MSKARKLYILVAFAMPLAIAVVVLALAGGYLSTVTVSTFIFSSAVWIIWSLIVARRISKRRGAGKTYHAAERTPRHRRMMVIERIFWLLIFLLMAANLAKALVSERPLYLILAVVWWIIVSVGHLLFVRLMTDE